MVGCSHHTMGLLRGGGDPGSVQPSALLVLLLPDLAHPDPPTLPFLRRWDPHRACHEPTG